MSLSEVQTVADRVPSADPESVRLPPELLHRLLQALGVAANLEELRAAATQAEANLPSVQAVDEARYLFTQAQIKAVLPIQLAWRRFDLRRLPALVLHEGAWNLAERAEGEDIALSDATGVRREIPEAELQDALVLWLRTPAQASKSVPSASDGQSRRPLGAA